MLEKNYKEDREKGRKKTVVCTNLKKKTSTKCGVIWCVEKTAGKNTTCTKRTNG